MDAQLAVIQMVSSDIPSENFEQAAGLIREAAREGAKLILLPENFAFMGRH